MRYHRAIEITEEQATDIKGGYTEATSGVAVVSQGDRYYDVRAMTDAEIRAFVGDLARSEFAAVAAAAARPH